MIIYLFPQKAKEAKNVKNFKKNSPSQSRKNQVHFFIKSQLRKWLKKKNKKRSRGSELKTRRKEDIR